MKKFERDIKRPNNTVGVVVFIIVTMPIAFVIAGVELLFVGIGWLLYQGWRWLRATLAISVLLVFHALQHFGGDKHLEDGSSMRDIMNILTGRDRATDEETQEHPL